MPAEKIDLEIYLVTDDDGVTIAELFLADDVTTSASAKVCEPDTYDQAVGDALAIGRALRKMGRDLIRQAYSKVHYIDKTREHQQAASQLAHDEKMAHKRKFEMEFTILIEALHPGTFHKFRACSSSSDLDYPVKFREEDHFVPPLIPPRKFREDLPG